jgi:hypothetical protein
VEGGDGGRGLLHFVISPVSGVFLLPMVIVFCCYLLFVDGGSSRGLLLLSHLHLPQVLATTTITTTGTSICICLRYMYDYGMWEWCMWSFRLLFLQVVGQLACFSINKRAKENIHEGGDTPLRSSPKLVAEDEFLARRKSLGCQPIAKTPCVPLSSMHQRKQKS